MERFTEEEETKEKGRITCNQCGLSGLIEEEILQTVQIRGCETQNVENSSLQFSPTCHQTYNLLQDIRHILDQRTTCLEIASLHRDEEKLSFFTVFFT